MTEKLRTFAPNHPVLTDFHSQLVPDFCKHNAQALVLGATGETLSDDRSVSAGHKHDTEESAIVWRQVATYKLQNGLASSIGSAPDQCTDALLVGSTSETDLALLLLWLSPLEAAALEVRLRYSNSVSFDDLAMFSVYFSALDGTPFTDSGFSIDTNSIADREWFAAPPIDVSGGTVDADFASRIPFLVRLTGQLADLTQKVALHEIAFGVSL